MVQNLVLLHLSFSSLKWIVDEQHQKKKQAKKMIS
ncbi:hypothetical protein SLEP1_g9688 [Rubroshorea leprosula]|uniref:Uncharacterized protein n=1 Tax=Rubroshorea leprosula TaxID=152421 RepID=A0AAV5IFL7_9ROSI|nr:hypothetical protein SLEP1_g9688 [Rubroshorea leprosula]